MELEEQEEQKLTELRLKLESDLQEKLEEMEKKHAYKMEQMRQNVSDRHKEVGRKILVVCSLKIQLNFFHSAILIF